MIKKMKAMKNNSKLRRSIIAKKNESGTQT